MFKKLFLALSIILINRHVNCAMKKSWKSAANFDSDIPQFISFDDGKRNDVADLNDVEEVTIVVPSSPSPSAETLTGKISSKFKAPLNYADKIRNQFHKESKKSSKKDFGSFDVEEIQPVGQTPVNIDEFEQDLNELSEDADRDEQVNDGRLEIESYSTDDTNTTQYKVGPLMNLTIDSDESIVNLNLNQNTLKEIFTGSSCRYEYCYDRKKLKAIKLLRVH